MVVQMRIDERLIHGQIVTAWSKYLDINAIVVANDAVSKDDMTKKVLQMGAPTGKKVAIRSIDDTIQLLSDSRSDKMKVLLIVDNPKDAITLTEALNVKDVNVGNFCKKKSDDKVTLKQYVSADPEDLELFKALEQVGENVFCQLLPTDSKIMLKDLLVKVK